MQDLLDSYFKCRKPVSCVLCAAFAVVALAELDLLQLPEETARRIRGMVHSHNDAPEPTEPSPTVMVSNVTSGTISFSSQDYGVLKFDPVADIYRLERTSAMLRIG
jgi:hypothetical protein